MARQAAVPLVAATLLNDVYDAAKRATVLGFVSAVLT